MTGLWALQLILMLMLTLDKHAVPLKNSKYRKAKEQEGYESAVGEVPDGAKETGEVQTAVPVSGRTIGWPAPAPNENPRGLTELKKWC